MADPETTNKGDLEDLFGDSDDEDFQPVEQQQQQPLDDAEAAPAGVRPHPPRLRTRHCDRQLQLFCNSPLVNSSKMTAEKVLVSTGRSRGRI